eukprot:gb/GECG01013580.1/.p1 GENE.gb/GECG01013580.1/~~gb/GECG01013580.1/.p1  ORF type:complete len:195 (+),score=9.95 gb/GECG01013580.1/:1-585(+)
MTRWSQHCGKEGVPSAQTRWGIYILKASFTGVVEKLREMASHCNYQESCFVEHGRGLAFTTLVVEQFFGAMRGTASKMPTQKEYADKRCLSLREWTKDAISQDFWTPRRRTVYPRGPPLFQGPDPHELFEVVRDTLSHRPISSLAADSGASSRSGQLQTLACWIQQLFFGTRQRAPRYRTMDNPGTTTPALVQP